MYCFTVANGLTCVLNELLLWSEISMEHPVFIKTVAELAGITLTESVKNELTVVSKRFDEIHQKAGMISRELDTHPYYFYNYFSQVQELIGDFLVNDRFALRVLQDVKQFGKENAVWQELLEHITKEQNFMYSLFADLSNQLGYYRW